MAGRIRRRTNCPVSGHGTRCIASWERRDANDHYRTTEERLALRYEFAAEGDGDEPPGSLEDDYWPIRNMMLRMVS